MRLRLIAVFLPLLWTALSCGGTPSGTIQLGAAVENVHYNADMSSASVTVVSSSQKMITAIDLAIDVEFKDGHTSHFELLRDLLPGMTSRTEQTSAADLSEGGVAPGHTLDFTVSLEKDTLAIRARVNAIAYLDLSGEGDGAALQRIAANRQEYAEGLNEGAAILSAALASTVTTDAGGMARRRLQETLANLKGPQKGTTGMKEMAYRLMLDDLQRPLTNAALKTYISHRSQEAEYHFNHAKIRKVN